jgi:tetratricopeptide (TPR) repeat protein
MKRILLPIAVLLVALLVTTARADSISLKQEKKPISGKIVAETAKGVEVKGRKEIIPAADISDIDYSDDLDVNTRLKAYSPAASAEAKARKAAEKDRPKLLDAAIAKYKAALSKIDPKLFAHRQVAFKLGYLTAEKADLTGSDETRLLAIDRLKDFQAKYPDSWQIGRALTQLARLLVESKAYDEAEKTYQALAETPVPEAVQQDALLRAAQLSMKTGKYDVARKKLEALAAKLPADSPANQKARLSAAECLALTGKVPAARDLVTKVLAEAKDPTVRAAGYNTLGQCDLLSDNLKEARWDFLWVDTVYNQDPAEHARALYYLHQVFARLNDPERARECLETLLNEQQFANLDYQRKARAGQKQTGGGS